MALAQDPPDAPAAPNTEASAAADAAASPPVTAHAEPERDLLGGEHRTLNGHHFIKPTNFNAAVSAARDATSSKRLRAAATATAAPRLQLALEAAASGDDALLGDALDELDAQGAEREEGPPEGPQRR